MCGCSGGEVRLHSIGGVLSALVDYLRERSYSLFNHVHASVSRFLVFKKSM